VVDVIDGNDVGVVEGGCGAGFLLEAAKAFGVRDKLFPQHLDGHIPAELVVLRPIDFAHSARAEQGSDLVGAESGTGLKCHR
jgi:hypothetical protein